MEPSGHLRLRSPTLFIYYDVVLCCYWNSFSFFLMLSLWLSLSYVFSRAISLVCCHKYLYSWFSVPFYLKGFVAILSDNRVASVKFILSKHRQKKRRHIFVNLIVVGIFQKYIRHPSASFLSISIYFYVGMHKRFCSWIECNNSYFFYYFLQTLLSWHLSWDLEFYLFSM